jgi:hypothetical protein
MRLATPAGPSPLPHADVVVGFSGGANRSRCGTPSPSWRDTASHGALVEWTAHSDPPAIQHMCIDHRRLDICVAQQFLDRPVSIALWQQIRRTAVPQGMAAEACGESCPTTSPAHGPLQPTFMGVMAADDPRPRVFRQTVGGKDVWPEPEPAGMGILTCQRKRSADRSDPLRDILRMSWVDEREMFLEGGHQAGGQPGDPIVHPLAIPYDDLLLGEIEVFDAQPQTRHQAHPRAIEHLGHQLMGP